MKRNNTKLYSQKGLTLIEIMIALVIGSFLMIGAMGLFMSNKRIYTEQDAMGRLQENARFAMNLLIDDLRMAGYSGCSDDSAMVTNSLAGSGVLTNLSNFSNPIEGSENTGGWLPSGSGDPVGTSDAITIRYIDSLTSDVSFTTAGTMADEAANIPVTCTGGDCNTYLNDGDALAISDCATTDIFSVDVNASNLNPAVDLSRVYSDAAQITRYATNRYYIANNASGDPSLFRHTFAQDKDDFDSDTNKLEFIEQNQELIEGIENMQIIYGVDNDADLIPNGYVNATGVAGAGGWANVVSVRIAILVRTDSNPNNEIDSNTYNLLGTVIPAANDQRRRRVFSTTVEIRNRT